jgi:hypothetical protein
MNHKSKTSAKEKESELEISTKKFVPVHTVSALDVIQICISSVNIFCC